LQANDDRILTDSHPNGETKYFKQEKPMADIATGAGVVPDEPFLTAASKLCTHLWDEMWSRASGTAGGDADDLHDMRVALRRLRSALQSFEGEAEVVVAAPPLRRQMKRWRRRLGKLGDALGAVRDRDVLDEYVRAFAKDELKISIDDAPGLGRLERALQNERADFYGPMVKRINRAREDGGQREKFARWAANLAEKSDPDLSLRQAAHQILPARLNEVLALGDTLQDDDDEIGHHDLRKALRRLRYALEIFGPAWDEELKPHLKTIVAGQDLLGEMQDRFVLRESIARVFSIDESDQSTLPEDLRAFLEFGERRRVELLIQARSYWKGQIDTNFFEHLRAMQ